MVYVARTQSSVELRQAPSAQRMSGAAQVRRGDEQSDALALQAPLGQRTGAEAGQVEIEFEH